MNSTTAVRPEFRTPEWIDGDEAVAAEHERFIVSDATTGWTVHEATDARRELAAADPANAVAVGGLNTPFLWNGGVYRITRARRANGRTELDVQPPDARFEAEVRRRIEASRCKVLSFYQGFGFVCFPEDHAKYQG